MQSGLAEMPKGTWTTSGTTWLMFVIACVIWKSETSVRSNLPIGVTARLWSALQGSAAEQGRPTSST